MTCVSRITVSSEIFQLPHGLGDRANHRSCHSRPREIPTKEGYEQSLACVFVDGCLGPPTGYSVTPLVVCTLIGNDASMLAAFGASKGKKAVMDSPSLFDS